MIARPRGCKTVVSLLLAAAAVQASCRTVQPDQKDTSQALAETDDTATDRTSSLINVDAKIEAHVNQIIAEARTATRPPAGWDEAARQRLLRQVYDRLGAYRPGTGIRMVPVGPEVSLHPEIVYWLGHVGLDAAANEIVFLKFSDTIYRDNDISITGGKVLSHKTQETADHSIAPVIRIGGVLMGTDKVGHYFMQGYWYWHAGFHNLRTRCEYGQYMEGNPILFEERWRKYRDLGQAWIPSFRFGYFGAWSTGVISMADGEANEAGYQFYKHLYDDPDNYTFSWSDYQKHLPFMNENNNPSKFAYGIAVTNGSRTGERPKDSCWPYDRWFN